MSDEQYNELIQRLDRIIELLSSTKEEPLQWIPYEPLIGYDTLHSEHYQRLPQRQGTCMECAKGTCKKDYSHT